MGRPKAGARYKDPLDYEQHPYDSMKRFAQLLALRYDRARTRHSYYRDLRLLHEHFGTDPAGLTEDHLRDYILHVKTRKHWKPKTIRQTAAAARLFFVDLMKRGEWKVFSQIRTKDHDELPAVLSREDVRRLLSHIHLRRYRIPVKLIYGAWCICTSRTAARRNAARWWRNSAAACPVRRTIRCLTHGRRHRIGGAAPLSAGLFAGTPRPQSGTAARHLCEPAASRWCCRPFNIPAPRSAAPPSATPASLASTERT